MTKHEYKFEVGAAVAVERLVTSLFFLGSQTLPVWFPAKILATVGEDGDEASCKVKFLDADKNDPGFIASKSEVRLLRAGNPNNPTEDVRKCYWIVNGKEEVFAIGAPDELYLGDAVLVLFQNGIPSAHHPNAAKNDCIAVASLKSVRTPWALRSSALRTITVMWKRKFRTTNPASWHCWSATQTSRNGL